MRKFCSKGKNFFIFGLTLIATGFFEFHPAVKYWRVVVPENIYVGKACDCACILSSRPWFSKFNYWFWLWMIATPVIVFSVKPITPRWKRTLRTVAAVAFCYGVMNLALHLMWDIRNGPFTVYSDYPWQKSWDEPGAKCTNIADGAGILFTALFGWIYAVIYTGWWEIIWYQYHKRQTGVIGPDFRRDILSKVIAFISYIAAKLALFSIVALPFAIGILYLLEKFEILKGHQSFFP